jgi:hypothetical protein
MAIITKERLEQISQELEHAFLDAEAISRFVNGEDETVTSRLGQTYKSIKKIVADLEEIDTTAMDSADAAVAARAQIEADIAAGMSKYLIRGYFAEDLSNFTSALLGDPDTRVTIAGTFVSGDPDFAGCGELVVPAEKSNFVNTKGACLVMPGRIYQVSAVFKVTALFNDEPVQFKALAVPMDYAFGGVGAITSSDSVTVSEAGAVHTVSMLVSTNEQPPVPPGGQALPTNVQQLTAGLTTYFRAGLRKANTTTGDSTVLLDSILVEDVTEAYGVATSAGLAMQYKDDAESAATVTSGHATTTAEQATIAAEWAESPDEISGSPGSRSAKWWAEQDIDRIPAVDNLQDLRDHPGLETTIYARGHTDPGDGLGGIYNLLSAGGYTDDDMDIVVPTGGGGSVAWVRDVSAGASGGGGGESGVYQPVLITYIGLDECLPGHTAVYSRVGDVITVSGQGTVTVSSGGEASFDLSLPVSTTFPEGYGLYGVAFFQGESIPDTDFSGGISVGNVNHARFYFSVPAVEESATWFFTYTFQYLVV